MNADRVHPGAASPPRSRWLGPALLLALWLVGVFLMLAGAADPEDFDPESYRYGANWPGDLAASLRRSVAELLVLAALLRPWSFRRSTGRLLAALAVFLPWTLLSTVVTMHAGPVTGRHVAWLWIVCLALLVAIPVAESSRQPRATGEPA